MEAAARRSLHAGKPPALFPALLNLCSRLPQSQRGGAFGLASQLYASAAARPDLALAHLRCPASTPRGPVTYNALLDHLPPTASSSCRFRPNVATLLALLRASHALPPRHGLAVHAYLLKTAYIHTHNAVPNSLLAMYAAFGDPLAAAQVFDEMPLRDVVSWTSMIGACLAAGCAPHALRLFSEMLADATLEVDGVVLVVALRACAMLQHLRVGSSVHAVAARRGLQGDDVFVANSLVDMYAKCLDLGSARKLFDLITNKNVVSWNTMLSGLVHADRCPEALELFASSSLPARNGEVVADETTLVVLLQLCKKLGGQAMWCRSVHAAAVRRLLLSSSTPLLNALLDAYGKCGLVEHALRLFQGMRERNVVTWSTAIAACAHNGTPHEAIACFVEMREAGERPNSITMLSLLEACADSAEMRASKCAHGVAVRSGLASEQGVSNALVGMYGKCGDLAASTRVFDAMPAKDVLTWNSMIGALGMNGRASDALALLDRMEAEDAVKPNSVTMLAVLSACAHGGLVQEGIACFERMAHMYSLQPQAEHLSCVVDMLARRGDLDGAAKIIEERIASGSPAAWSALLSACRSHGGDREVGRGAARRVLELEPGNSAGYLLSMSMYATSGGAAAETARMRWLMKEKGVKVTSGHSLVHAGRESHRFVSWDGSHPHRAQVYSMLQLLHWHMRQQLSLLQFLTTI